MNLGFLLLRKKLIRLQSLMLSRFNRLANSEKVQEILSLKCCTSCLKGSRKIASEENCPPPALILRLIVNQTLTLTWGQFSPGAIFRTSFERRSLGSTLRRCANVFDPTCFLDMTQEKLQIRWKVLLKCFSELHILSSQKCDKAMLEFKSFVCDTKSMCQVELQGFISKVRLEKFYFEEICI